MLEFFKQRKLPEGLEGLDELALDLRWTGRESSDRIWQLLDPDVWELTKNPYMILQNVPRARLEEAAGDKRLQAELHFWLQKRRRHFEDRGWFGRKHASADLKNVAYFSMEFLIRKYLQFESEIVKAPMEELLAFGRQNPEDNDEPFNMAYFAMRGSCFVNGVSRLHGKVSRRIFQPLYRDWPQEEVPVGHITNGVHMPSWRSPEAEGLWGRICEEDYWLGAMDCRCQPLDEVSDTELWDFRAASRYALVNYVRRRLARQVQEHGEPAELRQRALHVLDPNALTLGFARRFAAYKRPNLLLYDPERLERILFNPERPVRLIIAGKAHPNDDEGKRMIQSMARFAAQPGLFDRVVFLEDYDMALAQQLAAGIDVWINTPRCPCEACGTSGMKLLVNGGINLSELDGWWAEAYSPDVGWALGDGREHNEPGWDFAEAGQFYEILEQQVIPSFYERDRDGIPKNWIDRLRTSMAALTPAFSSNRMLREYVEKVYLPAARGYRARVANNARVAIELHGWQNKLAANWRSLRFQEVQVVKENDFWVFEVVAYLGDLEPDFVSIELYCDPLNEVPSGPVAMDRKKSIPGVFNGYLYVAKVPAARPAEHYTPRIVPHHPDAFVPLEDSSISWRR